MYNVTVQKTKDYLVVKIPLRAVKEGRAELSPRARKVVDAAIDEGLADIRAGRTFGPFNSVGEFKRALRTTHSRKK